MCCNEYSETNTYKYTCKYMYGRILSTCMYVEVMSPVAVILMKSYKRGNYCTLIEFTCTVHSKNKGSSGCFFY
jgi:hypothetical protein